MLAKFSVTNYMGFPQKITWDLSQPRDYSFNSELIKDNIVKNGIIYGENGSGKTSLGRAVFDIVNLTNTANPTNYSETIFRGSPDRNIDFEYTFIIAGNKIEYAYSKNIAGQLVKESLRQSGNIVFEKDNDHLTITNEFPIERGMMDSLVQSANSVSILKFIFGTFPLTEDHYIKKLMDFINSMLWFRCLDERRYIGLDTGLVNIAQYIIRNDYLKEFAEFLNLESKQTFDFSPTQRDSNVILCKMGGYEVPFHEIISTGTSALELLFYWIKRIKESGAKFVFIDEFDAFYHFELSMNVCRTLFKEDFQVFMTSHNTMLLSNDLLRPDCGFLIDRNRIAPLSDLTSRGELRQGHNIEKMYRAGAFNLK